MKKVFLPNMELNTDAYDKTTGSLLIDEGLTLGALLERFELTDCIVLIDGEYRQDDYQLREGDVIRFIPSGG